LNVAVLTNADRAVIDTRKLTDYALNPDNPVGRHKARVFAGFDRSNLHLLIEELRRGVLAHAAEPDWLTSMVPDIGWICG
jgi:filamentous hemagglutinin